MTDGSENKEEKSDARSDIRRQLESTLGELKTMGSEIADKLGAHAKEAKEEAKSAWKKLQPQLENAEAQLEKATDTATEQLQHVFGELKNKFRALRDKL
jgi:ElaB/YqjD/DUF883 family membrane-anchored ribosome-binding protein